MAAIVASLSAHSAVAAEAFRCGTNYVVHVEPEDLEAAKRTDPCVASHFGLKLKSDAIVPVVPAKRAMRVSSPIDLPFRASIIETSPKELPAARSAPARAPSASRPVISSPATNYGPVRILNASTSDTSR